MTAATAPVVVLIGPMGSGKTTVGRELAALLGVPFADLDALVVERDGRSIPDIFAAEGEDGFRAREHEALQDALVGFPGVLALGGGALTHNPSREAVRGHATVLLEVDETAVARRLHGGRGRPLLEGPDPLARWREIAAARMPLYRQAARWSVDSSVGSPRHVARRIARTLQNPAPGPTAPGPTTPTPTTEQETA